MTGNSANQIKIYPSILSCDFGRLREEVLAVENAGADGLHVDVMDGHFVPNLTLGAPILKSLKGKTKLELDCHLMVSNPDFLIKDFADAGAHRVTIHQEATKNLGASLALISSHGLKTGVSIKPKTGFESLEAHLNEINLILVMTVEPGFGGQALIPDALKKAGALVEWLKEKTSKKILVQIDGGVNELTAPEARALGIDILVAGSAVFGKKDYSAAIRSLRGSALGGDKT